MNKFILSALSAAVLFASCSNNNANTSENKSDTQNFTPAPDTNQRVIQPSNNLDSVPGTGAVQTLPSIQQLPAKPSVVPASSGKAVKLNPEHGQPGHRCDLAVGDPLPAEIAPASGPKTVRLNPAHGEPGHDCSVEVGKPLKN